KLRSSHKVPGVTAGVSASSCGVSSDGGSSSGIRLVCRKISERQRRKRRARVTLRRDDRSWHARRFDFSYWSLIDYINPYTLTKSANPTWRSTRSFGPRRRPVLGTKNVTIL